MRTTQLRTGGEVAGQQKSVDACCLALGLQCLMASAVECVLCLLDVGAAHLHRSEAICQAGNDLLVLSGRTFMNPLCLIPIWTLPGTFKLPVSEVMIYP